MFQSKRTNNIFSKMIKPLFLLIILLKKTLQQNSNKTLLPNIVVDPYFTLPQLPTGQFYQLYPKSIYGWNCTLYCEIDSLQMISAYYNLPYNSSSHGQCIDLDSVSYFQSLSQHILITSQGNYSLSITWLRPLSSPLGKSFGVFINSTQVAYSKVHNTKYQLNLIQLQFYAALGVLTLKIVMLPSKAPDGSGIIIVSALIRQIIQILPFNEPLSINPVADQIIQKTIVNNATSIINSIPGNRVIFSSLTTYMRNLDRLQFYYYHHQNLTYYSNILLSNANAISDQRGIGTRNLFYSCQTSNQFCTAVVNRYEYLLDLLNQKYNYTDSDFLSKNSNGIGFFANNLDVFYFQIPSILIIYCVFSILFSLLFNHRISRLIRQYSFLGTLLFLIFQGNFQQFSFYFFAQCRNLFSASFHHKIANIFMIFFIFLLIVFIFGGILVFKFHYKSKVKYFVQGFKLNNLSLIFFTLNWCVIPFFFGAVHVFLIDDLFYQTIVLAIIQVCYITVRVRILIKKLTNIKYLLITTLIASILRLIFTISFYIYNQEQSLQNINLLHLVLDILYILCIVIEEIGGLIALFTEIKQTIFYNQTKKQRRQQKYKQNPNSIANEFYQNQTLEQTNFTKQDVKYQKSQLIKNINQKTTKNINRIPILRKFKTHRKQIKIIFFIQPQNLQRKT